MEKNAEKREISVEKEENPGRFGIPAMPQAPASAVFQEGKFRITVLTPRLVRVETSVTTDEATQTVWYRNFPETEYEVWRKKKTFRVQTESTVFLFDYDHGMRSIRLQDGRIVREFHKSNLMGTARTLDGVDGATPLNEGVLSRNGVAVLDDSKSLLLKGDGVFPREHCSDYYYFAYGNDYRGCLQDFFRLTGPVPLIPKYALGNWWSRYKAYTQQEYQDLMQEFIDRELPITVATIDMDWHWTDVVERFGEEARPIPTPGNKLDAHFAKAVPGWTGYSWNTELFPDYKAMLKWLHEKGFRVTLNVHPSQGVRFFEEQYEAMCRYLGKDPALKEQIAFDVTDHAFLEAYFDFLHHPYEEDGVDFWWLDWQQGTCTAIPGLDPLWALNHYHTLDHARGKNRPMILSRYAGMGSHRYPLGFSGDTVCSWASLKFQPYFTSTASNAGYTWWSHDIGGHFMGVQDDELYLRWLQYGVFSPINRLHSTNNELMGKEPWKRSAATEQMAEKFLRLRHKLIPYLYTVNYHTHKDGRALCEPMYYEYDCKEAYEAKDQYLFGGQLLVRPVLTARDRKTHLAAAKVWLPEGRWTDIFSDRIYQGGGTVTMHRDLDAIPVLAREGSIVPMYAQAHSNNLSLDQPMELHVWRGNGHYELYEDDGETKAFEDGSYVITPMEVREENGKLTFTIGKPQGNTEMLPKGREVCVHFRDIVAGKLSVNGVPAVSCVKGHLAVKTVLDGTPIEILIEEPVAKKNQEKKEAMIALLTRVQGDNEEKAKWYVPALTDAAKRRKLPQAVRSAMEEIDALFYDE